MRFRHTFWMAAGMAALLAAGCAGPEAADTDATGMARVTLVTPQIFSFELTRISLETDTGFSGDLERDSGPVFTGTLLLPVGVHELTARAFAGDEQVGVSSPVPAEIQAGAVTQVMIQILDSTGGPQPDFGPLLESLSHPTSTAAGSEVMFAVSIIDPDGTPVDLEWSDDCDDSTFTAPQSSTTGWSKATPGACRITVLGASNGLFISQSFQIAAFAAGSDQGAVDVITEFIGAPVAEVQLSVPGNFCFANQFSPDASCALEVASPTVVSLQAFATDWQNGTPGTLTMFDDCGGSMGVIYQDTFVVSANWLPPVQGGLCRMTARAVNQEGVVGEMTMAVLVRPGTPRQPSGVPSVAVDLFGPLSFCSSFSDAGEAVCGPIVQPGGVANLSGSVFWSDTLPGSIDFTDTCGGAFFGGFTDIQGGGFGQQWQAPAAPVTDCTITVTATSLEGLIRSAVFRFDVL